MFYGAFLGPIGAILIFNSIVFAIIAKTAIKHRKKKTSKEVTTVIGLILRLIFVTFLLGLTWVFGALTIVSEASLAFQILFALLNSLQGLFLFLFFCVLNKDARKSWKRVFSCGRDKRPFQSSHLEAHFKDRRPRISSSGTGTMSQSVTLRNSDVRFSTLSRTSEQLMNQVSTGSEMRAIKEENENPVTELSAKADQISTCSESIEIYFIQENPDTLVFRDTSPDSVINGITVIENHRADSISD